MLTPGSKQAKKGIYIKDTFFSLLLLLVGLRRLCRVVGDSMHPTIREGDLVIYKPFDPNKEALKKGYLVVLNNPLKNEELIVKRVSNKRSNAIELRGDNEEASIDSRQFGFINQTEIIGIVKNIFPILK